jgi:predicted amidohydrolase
VRSLLAKSPPQRGALVALPEMFASGFSMNVAAIAEDEAGAGERFTSETAKQFGVYLIGGLVTRGADGRGRNEALVASPEGEIVARYCKMHPYAPGKEAEHYSAGDDVVTFRWPSPEPSPQPSPGAAGEGENGFTVAPFICYDLRFPEAFRVAMDRGANVMVVIASWPSPRVEHWTTLLRARAIENQAYVLGVNRCGRDPFLEYPGKSVIYDPSGKLLAEAGSGEQIIAAEAEAEVVARYRQTLPFLQDRRDDLRAAPARAARTAAAAQVAHRKPTGETAL